MDSKEVAVDKRTGQKVLIATITASAMAFIDFSALNIALPIIQRDFNMGGNQLLWISNAYALFLSALLLLGGSLGDIFGRNRIFRIGIVVFIIASFFCGISPTPMALIIGRIFQGIGGALMMPGSLAILTAVFPVSKRGWAIGIWSMFSALTTIIGPVLGGILAEAGLWRFIFFINIPLGIFSILMISSGVPETRGEKSSLDPIGALLATIGLAGLTYGFIEAPRLGFSHPLIQGTLAAGIVSLILFLIIERRSKNPMMPLTLFKSRNFSVTNLQTLFIYAALGGFILFLPLNMVQVQGYRADTAGIAFLPFAFFLAGLARLSGSWVDKVGPRIPLTLGPLLTGISFALFALPGMTAGESDYWTTYFLPTVLMGAGMGLTVSPLTTTVMSAVSQHNAGIASGINNTIARTAGVLAVAIMGSYAIFTFGNGLENELSKLNADPVITKEMLDQSIKLAETTPPDGLETELTASLKKAVGVSFVDTFNVLAWISAILCWISAGLSILFLKRKKPGS